MTAKQVASVDRLSGGRMLFGVGAGWNVEEMRNHGTDPKQRFGIMRERVEAMKEIWTSDEASYHGRHVDFDRIWSLAEAAHRPHPPILSAATARTVDRPGARLRRRVDAEPHRRRRASSPRGSRACGPPASESGRGPIPSTVCAFKFEPDALERFEAAGAHRAMFWLPQGNEDDLAQRLDRRIAAIAAYQQAG